MEPGDFSQMINKLTKDPSNKQKLYLENGDLKIDDNIWPIADSELFDQPGNNSDSPAKRYVDLCRGRYGYEDLTASKIATYGLIGVYKSLPKSEGKALMNDAEDYYTKMRDSRSTDPLHYGGRAYADSPLLNIRFRDFDKDGQDELSDVRLTYGGYRRSPIQFDLYNPPASVLTPRPKR